MVKKWILALLIIIIILLTSVALADSKPLQLSVGDCRVITVAGFTRVATSNPDVVEIVVTSGQEVLLNAKKPGLAVVNIWGSNGLYTLRITVQDDYSNIEKEIERLIKNPNVKVTVNAKYVILDGSVATSLDSDQAIQYAKMYRDNVISNLDIKVKYQILLSIMVTEVTNDFQNKYGMNWGEWTPTQNGLVFNQWQWSMTEKSQNSFGRMYSLGSVLEAMQKNGDAKILAAPSILTLSGKAASFMAGGEIPIPLADGQGGIKVEWKEYGVKLDVTPSIGRENMISMSITPEVSSLDWANAVQLGGDKLPAIATRKATTNVQFTDGSTLVIGGLLKREDSVTVFKMPIIGDLPIIGPLFRSKEFDNGKTELLIFVTPTIVKNGDKIDSTNLTQPQNQGPYYNTNKKK